MQQQLLEQARVLVVDDDAQNVRYIQDVLEWAGYRQVKGTTQPTEVLGLVHQLRPDLLLLDLIMPRMDGYEVMEVLQSELPDESYLPILVLTSDTSQEAKRRALSLGAKDFLTKPFSPTEIRHRVSNLLETRFLHLKCNDQAAMLASNAPGGFAQAAMVDELLERLVRIASHRADPSGARLKRVGRLAGRLASALGQPEAMARRLERAAQLYDLGMVGAPDRSSEDDSDPAEAFPEHTEIGAQLLGDSELPELQLAAEIALSHHERWDGGGFPRGLRAQDVPVSGRIVAVAVAFEMAREEEMALEGGADHRALSRVEAESGRSYDPAVVDALAAALLSGAEATTPS